MKYRVFIEQDEDGMYVADVPSLPGCISQGRTRAEALANIKEAIEAYLESLEAHNEPIPPPISEEIVEVSTGIPSVATRGVGRSRASLHVAGYTTIRRMQWSWGNLVEPGRRCKSGLTAQTLRHGSTQDLRTPRSFEPRIEHG